MTYLAPRQGQFAMVLLVSFCLQVGVFVTSTHRTLKAQEATLSESLLQNISNEIKTPLMAGDRISLSVIATRYERDPFVGYVGIYDSFGGLVAPAGVDNASSGKQATIQHGGETLGKVVLKPAPISRASIVSEHWIFLLFMLGVHVVLWMLYGHIARPTQQMYDSIRQRTRQSLLATGLIGQLEQSSPKAEQKAPSQLGDYLSKTHPNADDQHSPTHQPTPAPTALVVQLAFKDHDKVLSALAQEQAERYFALCDELLQKMLKQLMLLPTLAGITQDQHSPFDANGAFVSLIKKDAMVDEAKLVLAAAMLAKLCVLVGETVYQKHRELKYFALPIKAMVCEPQSLAHAKKLQANHRGESLVMLPNDKLKYLTQVLNISPLSDPKSVYERQSYVIGELSPELVNQLTRLRKQVLSDKNA